jgi:iron(III) transport system ATP-binding protein
LAQVEVANLGKTFRQRQGNVDALRDVNLVVAARELVVLLGASGSGKSTLLRCVAGLERPSVGRISIGGQVVCDPATRTDMPPNRRDLGMVFQSYALWPHMTVRQNVEYPLRVRGVNSAEWKRVDEVLELVGCGKLVDRYPNALSGGQQQRVSLARALVARPRVLLFDEPLSNVDALLRLELRAQIRRIHEEVGFTGIYVTHDQSEALFVGDRVAFMKDGRLEQIDVPESVHRYPATEEAAIFLGAFMLPDQWTGRLLSQLPGLKAQRDTRSTHLATRPERLI